MISPFEICISFRGKKFTCLVVVLLVVSATNSSLISFSKIFNIYIYNFCLVTFVEI